MTTLLAVRTEFSRYRRMAELAVAQVDDDQLTARLDPDSNSIAILLGHLSGNLRSRFVDFLTTDGEKPWRQRDQEFEDLGKPRAELMADWDDAWRAVDDALTAIEAAIDQDGADTWQRSITIRQQPLSISEALLRSVAHLASHTGQIVLLARHWAGADWQTLSIPRGGSADYAKNPTRERSPE